MSSLIKVNAMVDWEDHRVVFVECDEDFADVLLSFLTYPIGIIVALTDPDPDPENPPTNPIGCMNNLYASVQNLDVKYFRTQACQEMLLYPGNVAQAQCIGLKIRIDDSIDDLCCLSCDCVRCFVSPPMTMLLLHYQKSFECGSHEKMQLVQLLDESDPVRAGVFLKGLTRFVITDDLQLMHPTNSLISDLGVVDATASKLEAKEIYFGKDRILNLLTSSLASKEGLTQALLYKDELHKENLFRWSKSLKRKFQLGESENGKISVKLFISKSKKIVCFAEVSEDFVDLVFSFLTIPLGHVLKQIKGVATVDGCVHNLYNSIDDLDVKIFKSSKAKEMLLNPKIPPKFGYDNQLIGVEEASISDIIVKVSKVPEWKKDKSNGTSTTNIMIKDPKIPTNHKEDNSNGGFMEGPAMFTVTDNLSVFPISPVSGLNILKKLRVPLSDVQERVVHIGNNEAGCLLIASFGTESALTHTFLKK